jgi:hypothetical protein
MGKEKNIKVIIVEPNKPARVETIVNELSVLQKLVGGYIECIREDGFDIIVNEEGKIFDLEPNFTLYNGDYVAGTAVFSGVDYKVGEFKSLTEEQIQLILKPFKRRG